MFHRLRPLAPAAGGLLRGLLLVALATPAVLGIRFAAQVKEASSSATAEPRTATERGVELYEQRRYAEAKQALEKAVAANPKDAKAQAYLGRVRADFDHDPSAAIAHLEAALRLDPQRSDFHQWLGSAYGDMADQVGVFKGPRYANLCRQEFEKAVELDPKSVEARDSLFDYYLQAPGFVGGGLDKARAQAAALLELDPSRGLIARAQIAAHEKDLARAEALYRQAVAAASSSGEPYDALGHFLLDAGRADEAVQVFRAYVQAQPSRPEAHADLAEGLFVQGRLDESLEECEKAIQLDPFYPEAHLDKARCLEAGQSWPQARQAYGRYLELVPGGKGADAARKKVKALSGK